MNDDNNFSYTYNAKEAAEVKKIRDRYAAPSENKLELLRRLDKNVSKTATTWSLIIGIIGTMIMGAGMSACLAGPVQFFFFGIAIGVVGIVLILIAYPIYSVILKRERKKMAPTILALTEEILK